MTVGARGGTVEAPVPADAAGLSKRLSLPHVDRSVTHIVLNTVKEERRLPV